MAQRFCPECGGELAYDPPTKRFACRSCGLYATREELSKLGQRAREEPESRRKKREQREYLEWWLARKK